MKHRYNFTFCHGFSMLELVVIIVLLGILAATAAPRLGGLSSYSLESATNELAEAIRFTQEASMTSVGSHYQIVTGSGNYRVRRYDLAGGSVAEVTSPLTGSTPFTASGAWDGISVGTVNLSFDNRGYPCVGTAPCNTAMSTTLTVTLSTGGESRSLTIEPLTGYVHAN